MPLESLGTSAYLCKVPKALHMAQRFRSFPGTTALVAALSVITLQGAGPSGAIVGSFQQDLDPTPGPGGKKVKLTINVYQKQ